MDTETSHSATEGLTVWPSVDRYPIGRDHSVAVHGEGPGWHSRTQRAVHGEAAEGRQWIDVTTDDGPSTAFVELLRFESVPPIPGFRLVRLVPPPQANGERPVEAVPPAVPGLPPELLPQDTEVVVVGERVVVSWTRRLFDVAHPAAQTMAHLAVRNFLGIPDTQGMLLWTTPSGREIPVAIVTKYLPRARDGWRCGLDTLDELFGSIRDGRPWPDRRSGSDRRAADDPRLGSAGRRPVDRRAPGDPQPALDLPARAGKLTAAMHLSLATASDVLPEPVGRARAEELRAWREHADAMLLRAAGTARRRGPAAGPVRELLPQLERLRGEFGRLESAAAEVEAGRRAVPVQHTHGDLHIGRLLRWAGGWVISGFDVAHYDPPRVAGREALLYPVARDVAQLLHSLDRVAHAWLSRIPPQQPTPDAVGAHPPDPDAVRPTGFDISGADPELVAELETWARASRTQLLTAYRAELELHGRGDLLDLDLIAAFEAEQVAREALIALEPTVLDLAALDRPVQPRPTP